MRFCNHCKEELTDENWPPSRQKNGQYCCKQCNVLKQREWKLRNPGHWRLRKYGITHEEVLKKISDQGSRCAICDTDNPGGRHNTSVGWHLDHDHKTGKNRGFLCWLCNTGLGKFKDSSELLRKAADYLDENS